MGQATAAKWGTLIGKMTFLSTLIPRGRLNLRPLQHNLKRHWDLNWKHRQVAIPVSYEVRQALQWWLDLTNLRQGVSLRISTPILQLFTDACLQGWGTHLGMLMVSGTWTEAQSLWHINSLELMAVIPAVRHFQDLLRNQVVLIATDNSTTLSYIRKQGGTKSHSLTLLTAQLFNLANQLNRTLQGRHIPGRRNVLADHPYRNFCCARASRGPRNVQSLRLRNHFAQSREAHGRDLAACGRVRAARGRDHAAFSVGLNSVQRGD